MSMHPTLVSKSKLKRQRSVLNRGERLEILTKEGRWDDEKSLFGLPKVKGLVIVKKVKVKVKKEEGAVEGAVAGAAPATGAAPAKGAASVNSP